MTETLNALFADIPFAIVATGALVGIAASLLGTFLVLRQGSMLTDAISHSIVLGIVVVWMLTSQTSGPFQLAGAALAGLLTVFLTELLARTGKVKDDAAIGLVFPALFSIGVLLLNLYARDVHVDQHTVLLGEIGFVWLKTVEVGALELPRSLLWMGVVTAVNASFVGLLFKELKLATFDPGLAASLGFAPGLLFYALLGLTSVTAVAAFEAVGAVLFVAFAIVPPAAAYLLTDRLGVMIAIGVAISVASSFLGYGAAVALDVSIGGSMAAAAGLFLALAFLFGPSHGLLARTRRRRLNRGRDARLALAIHLHAHEGRPEEPVESGAEALRTHLGWGDAEAAAVALDAARAGWVRRGAGGRLALTEDGREAALSLLEPWRDGTRGRGARPPQPPRPAP